MRPLILTALSVLFIYVAQSSMPWSIPWPDNAVLQNHVGLANHIYASGSYIQILQFSQHELAFLLPLHLFVLPRTLALFLMGMVLWRSGVFSVDRQSGSNRFLTALLLVGTGVLIPSLDLFSALSKWHTLTEWARNLAPILLAMGYGATILAFATWRPTGRLLAIFAPLGRMAFSNYLLQSIICCAIFYGYGLGLFGRLEVAPVFAFGVLLYVAQMLMSTLWLRRFRFGPMEWLWRSLMYGSRQPFLRRRE